MTDNASLLLNLLQLVESGKADFKLELSPTFYDVIDFAPRRRVYIDGVSKFDVSMEEMQDLSVSSELIAKYTRPPTRRTAGGTPLLDE